MQDVQAVAEVVRVECRRRQKVARGDEELEVFWQRSTTPKRNKHDGSCMHIQKYRQKELQKVSSITSVDMVSGDQGMHGLRMWEMTGKMNGTPRSGQVHVEQQLHLARVIEGAPSCTSTKG